MNHLFQQHVRTAFMT